MRWSRKLTYALKALMELAYRQGREPMSLREISGVTRVPVKFLEQIMVPLKQAGWIHSERGKEGGYLLDEDPREILLDRLISLYETGWQNEETNESHGEESDRYSGIAETFVKLENHFHKLCRGVSLWDLCEKSKQAIEAREGYAMYYI